MLTELLEELLNASTKGNIEVASRLLSSVVDAQAAMGRKSAEMAILKDITMMLSSYSLIPEQTIIRKMKAGHWFPGLCNFLGQ